MTKIFYPVIFVSIIVTIFSIFLLIPNIKSKLKFNNFSFSTIIQKYSFQKNFNYNKLLKEDTASGVFKASHNNLGTIEVLVDNHNKVNSDKISFVLKELNTGNTIYKGEYPSSLMDVGQYFPFGFPIIYDSKGKTYNFEITSLLGTSDNSVSIKKNSKFNIKYIYSKDYLLSNKNETPRFLLSKLGNLSLLFDINIMLKFIILTFTPIFLYYRFIYKKNLFLNQLLTDYIAKVINVISNNKYLLLIFFIYFLIRLRFLDYKQHWDSEWYWNLLLKAVTSLKYAPNFNEAFKQIIENFNFLGHPSMGYISLFSLGQFIDYGNVKYLNITNLLLSLVSIWGFYKILNFFNPNKNKVNYLTTLIFALNPLAIATSISFNLDFPLLVFEIMSLYSLMYKKYIQFILWSLMLIFSKETGLIIYTSQLIGYLVFVYLPSVKFKINKTFIKKLLLLFVPLIIFTSYIIYNGGNFWNSRALENTGNNLSLFRQNGGYFGLAFDKNNILLRSFQIFIMNFTWLIVLPAVGWIVFSKLIKKQSFSIIKKDKLPYLKMILFTFGILVLFNYFYVVMPFARYTVSAVFYVYILTYLIYIRIFINRETLFKYLLLVIAILSFMQIFKAIDFSPRVFYGTNYIGNQISSPVFGYRDGTVYNIQFTFVDYISRQIKRDLSANEYLLMDEGATYYFNNFSISNTVENIDKQTIPDNVRIKYINVPWFLNVEDRINSLNEFFVVENNKQICYSTYCVQIFELKKRIKNE